MYECMYQAVNFGVYDGIGMSARKNTCPGSFGHEIGLIARAREKYEWDFLADEMSECLCEGKRLADAVPLIWCWHTRT